MNSRTTVNLDDFALPSSPATQQNLTAIPEGKERKIQSQFSQMQDAGKTHCKYSRFNHRFLSIKKQQKNTTLVDGVIDLSFLQAEPKELRHFPLIGFAAAIALLVLTATLYFFELFNPVFLMAPAILSICLLGYTYEKRQHCYHFLSLYGDISLFEINALHPGKELVSAYIIDLQQAISTASGLLPKGKQLTPIAVAEMRRLKESGMISETEYEQLKQAFFAHS
ncbi:MAG: hypothetical protein HRU20_05535 [Pseudomonadales bacterium]|nr:hypothetical protein [Pseudomonadales bacterium]